MKKQPQHQLIYRELLAEILAGKHDSARRLPSEAQLVKRFGVSRPTVARALRDLETQGTIERRAGSGSYLRRNSDVPTSMKQLGLIVPGFGDIEIFDIIFGELASLAHAHDLGMYWGGSSRLRSDAHINIEEADQLCERCIENGMSGVFFAPFEHTMDSEAANRRITKRLTHAGIVVILLDHDICPFPHRSAFDLVGIDNFAGGYLLADHLIKLGERRITFVARPFSATAVDARQAGACFAMRAHGITVAADFLQTGDCTDPDFVRRLTADSRRTAAICADDKTAAELMRSLTRMGTKVPHDFRVVGFDDVRFARLFSVPLTTIQQPCREIALTAFYAMRERIRDPLLPPRSLLLTPHLVVRESCGACIPR